VTGQRNPRIVLTDAIVILVAKPHKSKEKQFRKKMISAKEKPFSSIEGDADYNGSKSKGP